MSPKKRILDGNRTIIEVRQLDSDGIKNELDRMVALPETA